MTGIANGGRLCGNIVESAADVLRLLGHKMDPEGLG